MKRSQPITHGSFNQRRSIFSAHGGNIANSSPSASAVAMGRMLLNRPRAVKQSTSSPIDKPKTFIASAAGPIRKNSEATLKSCLSSSSISAMTMTCNKSSVCGSPANSNETKDVKMRRNVSFSHLQVREYEVTLGDNPAVSSGVPISLGWNYDPEEKISMLPELCESIHKRPRYSLKLSARERQRMLRSDPKVSDADLSRMLGMIADIKLKRKESLDEIHQELMMQKKLEEGTALLNELSFCA